MNYSLGDTVLYGTDGVCCISEITERKIGGAVMKYYILKPIYDKKSTILVPAANEKLLNKMKRILSEDEIYEALDTACSGESGWIVDDAERKESFRRTVESGDMTSLIKLLRAIYTHRQRQGSCGKKLHVADERTLKEIEKMLFDEFALVLNMNRSQVHGFLAERLGFAE